MEEYRIRVLSPDGIERHVLELDPPLTRGTPLYLAGGPRRMEVGPLGDCREATFEGDPTTLGIGPRDTVQVQYRTGTTGPWLNKYAGTAVITGSARSEVGRYKLQGFRYRRLTEVEVRTLLAEADLGAQVRQLFTDVIASGQLGSTLLPPTTDTIPSLNITSAAIQGNFWPAAKLIDERLKGRSRQTRTYLNPDGSTQAKDVNPDWGVNADLRPVFGYPTGTLVIDEIVTGVEIDGMDTDSSTLVTDVRVVFAQTLAAQGLENAADGTGNRRYQDVKSPLTYPISVAPRTFGEAWRGLPLPVDVSLFQRLPASNAQAFATGFIRQGAPNPPNITPTVTGNWSALWDGDALSAVTIGPPPDVTVSSYTVQLLFSDATPLPDGWEAKVTGGSISQLTVEARDGLVPPNGGSHTASATVSGPNTPTGVALLGDTTRSRLAGAWTQGGNWSSGKTVYIQITPVDPQQPVVLSAGTLVRVNPALLAASATPLARIPTLNPVTARLPGWNYSPAATAQLTLRDALGNAVETRELPIELLVYDTDDDGELYTEVRCGQRDEAEALSFTSAISARDQNATTDAVQAST
ncbi:hypothetical protein GCM10008956_15450 [Deinococcus arenae]|uniref:Uncharacterized protein n=1 Tax=Deinococcus arenae TaxID=1452751 RepID=A0A8H9L678_9DEIO|nr:hypothetical protein [Deinococcus arenae]GGM39927.1 hypothetical protein GCM10008956_15450 [Deinococcus arenae]